MTGVDIGQAFERRLDGLLARLCPEWTLPPLPDEFSRSEQLRAYWRQSRKRGHLARLLAEHQQQAIVVAPAVLATIVCDEDVALNRHLVEPMITVLGRRAVQEHLIATVASGSDAQKVCAIRAWYWTQVTLVYTSLDDLREHRATARSQAADDDVRDLRAWYRLACLTAFVSCANDDALEWLSRGFLLDPSYYPPGLERVLAAARAIALADPVRFKDLLARVDDGTTLAALRIEEA